MITVLRRLLPLLLLALLLVGAALGPAARAQDDSSSASDSDRNMVSIGHDVQLGKGEHAEDVVSVFGSSTVDGDVSDSVVSIFGDSHVSGNIGDSAVAVLGDVNVDSKIDGDVVAVFGTVRLGPHADVHGQVVDILGSLDRSPGSVIEGGTVGVMTGLFGNVAGLQAWVRECLLYGRPLAPDLRLGWVWGVAFALLALYLLIALLFRDQAQRCVQTLELHPGPSLLAAVLATLLVPVVMLALVITVVGIAAIPFLWLGLFCAHIFGRVVVLGWLGGRFLRLGNLHTATSLALAVLLGGVIAMALYLVPILGFIVYALLGVFGFGAVIYTIVLTARSARARPGPTGPHGAPTGSMPGGAGVPPAGSAASAGAAAASPAAAASWSTAGSAPPPYGSGGASSVDPSSEGMAQGAVPGASQGASGPGPGGPGPLGQGPIGQSAHSSWSGPALDPQLALTHPRAGFWMRMGALFIDLLLVSIALSLVVHHGERGMLLIVAGYAAIMWKLRGTTVGGIVFDLQVVRLDGRPIDWGTAIVRALACFLSLAVLGLGFFWIAIDPERQAWHDKIAGTVVVRVARHVAVV